MKDIFDKTVVSELKVRINKLQPTTQPQWGKMNVAQMLAHCNVTYELVYTDKHPKPNFFTKLMVKLFVKNMVVGEKPYPKNGRTAPMFLIANERDFEAEKQRLVEFLDKTENLGRAHFEGKESHSFGILTANEWNNMFYKHLNHHLTQFGV